MATKKKAVKKPVKKVVKKVSAADALIAECLTDLGAALKQFGEYSFDDKGPSEVMFVDVLVDKFRKLPAKEAADALVKLAKSKKYDGRPEYLVTEILCDMQDWDELFEANSEIGDYL